MILVSEMISSKAQTRKAKINYEVGLHQTEKLLHSKETINREPTKREKIFVNDVFDREFIFKICR